MSPSSHFLSVEIPALLRRGSMPDMRSPVKEKVEYHCKRCHVRITEKTSVISWEYRGVAGKGALVKQARNVQLSTTTTMLMNSGAYRVQSSSCASCKAPIGWKFIDAAERAEKWKEGYFVIELNNLQEESAPLSPLDPPVLERHLRLIPEIVIGHRRIASYVHHSDRTRPMGPRSSSTSRPGSFFDK